MLGMLKWIRGVAMDPCNANVQKLSDKIKGKSFGSDVHWKQMKCHYDPKELPPQGKPILSSVIWERIMLVSNLWRTSEEKTELERLEKTIYNSLRQAAEVHRKVRKNIRQILKPGMLMTYLCEIYWRIQSER